ncbi:Biopolymer transport exbD protein [Mucinivorans hirudinis]|uniref:Biopolymer transport exbD protein n=1 Tax=Mucinivorans hirudinis TaxID=1433126 RepID=A0A060RDD1_9BACT|nr:Biopolymer transport exbD protein [Mucinivorans hirudinis]
MARAKNEINASSTADIAFLLLIFYLVTTTMNVDSGISRTLPPMADPNQKDKGLDVKQQNSLQVKINLNDRILVGGQIVDISQVKDIAKNFIQNPNNDPNLPEKVDTEIELIGVYPVSQGIISLQNDRTTTYDVYVQVQNELTKAYNEAWNELATLKFGKPLADLDENQRKAIRSSSGAIPMRISEAEPVDHTKGKKK